MPCIPYLHLSQIQGPNLPFKVWGHTIIQYDETSIFLIGGKENHSVSRKTYIINPKNGFEIKSGPLLNIGRYGHVCGKAIINNKLQIVVAGGIDDSKSILNSVELLCPISNQRNHWSLGKHELTRSKS